MVTTHGADTRVLGSGQEAYLYHTVRRDPRHNFSPLYYPTYLAVLTPAATSWIHRCPTTLRATLFPFPP